MKKIPFVFNIFIFFLPLTFFPLTSELFEFNKMILVYAITCIILFLWAIACISQKRLIFKKTPLTAPIIIFLFTQILSTYYSIDKHTSLFGYYGRFHGGLLSYFCYSLLYFAFTTFMNKKHTVLFIKSLLISIAIATMWAFMEHFNVSLSCSVISGQINNSCWVQNVTERVFGSFGQPNWLAAFIVATIPIVWAKSLSKNHGQKNIYIVLSSLMCAVLVFTKSRSGVVGFLISFLVFWGLTLFYNKHHPIFLVKPLLIASLSALIVFITIIYPTATSSVNKSDQSIASDYKGGTESGEIRKIVWLGAVELWKRYPLLGTGVETFAYSYYETRPASHNLTSEWNYLYNKAHNEYLNFAATTGTLGLLSYILLIIAALKLQFKKLKNANLYNLAFFSGYLSLLATNFFGFSTVAIALLFFLFPAMAYSLANEKSTKFKKYEWSLIMKVVAALPVILLISSLFLITKYVVSDISFAKGNIALATKLMPFEPEYQIELAIKYASVGNEARAQKHLENAISASPRNLKIRKKAADVYERLGQDNDKYLLEALKERKYIQNYAPTDVQNFYHIALLYGKLGQIEDAKSVLIKTIDMRPTYKLARQYLASIHISEENYTAAIEEYEYILKFISPEDNEIRNALDQIK